MSISLNNVDVKLTDLSKTVNTMINLNGNYTTALQINAELITIASSHYNKGLYVKFPQAFKTRCLAVAVADFGVINASIHSHHMIWDLTRDGFMICNQLTQIYDDDEDNLYYIAIGY